jgi:hypothetical protein
VSHEVRTYDLDEANRALPAVRRLVERIVEISAALPDLEDRARIARYQASRPDAGPGAGDVDASDATLEAAERDLARAAIALQDMGVVLKDPRSGLVDFMSLRDGELVELCWKLGEDRIDHWHRIGEGFAGRKLL